MRAIVFKKYGTPDVLRLEEVPKPAPKDNEVLIKIKAATVSKADCEIRSFTFQPWLRLSGRIMFGIFKPRQVVQILGQELAGDIEAVGKDVEGFKKGDQIFAPTHSFGAHAEYICLPSHSAMAIKPANVSYEEAACITVFGLNALHFIRKAQLEAGQKIMINGAGGSIGTIAVQLAKVFGAEVTAVDGADKLEMLRSIGADHVIDFAQEDFTTNGVKYDVILDVVGKSPFSPSVGSLTRNGRYLIANPVGVWQMVRALWTSKTSDKTVIFKFATYETSELNFLKDLAEAGKIKPVIDRCYAMDQVVDAHRYIETGHKKGNVVMTMEHGG